MLLFIILSVYAALLVSLIIAAAVTARIPGWQGVTRYIVAGAIGTLLGFLIANGCVALAGFGPIWLAGHYPLPQWLNYAGAVGIAGLLFVGPIIASVVGVIAGFAAGIYYVFKRQRKLPPPEKSLTP